MKLNTEITDSIRVSTPPVDLKLLGEQLTSQYGFLGVPANTFEEAGRNQFITLVQEGLMPSSNVLEIGCGVLRVGYWLIHFLNTNRYYGIEPAKNRVEIGEKHLFTKEMLDSKKPKFDFNEIFDASVFGQNFDFFLAGSTWTHCSKGNIEVMLDGFINNTNQKAVFLVSYLPSRWKSEDYHGTEWVGTSHISNTAGCVRHSKKWIESQCNKRGLFVEQLSQDAFDSQYWLRISRHKTRKSTRSILRNVSNRVRRML